MRNTIRRKRHKIRKDRLVTFLTFFVLAPLISILLGLGLVKYVILPRFLPAQQDPTSQMLQDDISINNTEMEHEAQEPIANEQDIQAQNIQLKQSKVKGITSYNIQVGNFNSEENAQCLVKELISNGIPGYIVKLDSYNVFVGTYSDRDEADEYLSKVKNTYSDAFINTFSIIERVISYNEDEEDTANNLIDVIYAFDNAYDEELILWSRAAETEGVKLLLDTIANNTSNLETMIKKINTELKSEKLVQLVENLQNHISERENIITDLKNNNAGSLNERQIDFYNNYFEYVCFTK